MSRASRFGIAVTLFALIFLLAPAWAQERVAQPEGVRTPPAPALPGTGQFQAGQGGLPLRDFLNPDGTLNLPPGGIEGSLDPTGFRLVSGPGEEPRFVEDLPEEPYDDSGSREEAAGPRPEAAGDECWETRFATRGFNGPVYAVTVADAYIYVGGDFTMVGGVSAGYIAKWDGSSWSAVGTGTNGAVRAFVRDSTYLYVGGSFTTAGGVTALNVARYNLATSTWSACGFGLNGTVYALAYRVGTGVYAGGSFTMSGGNPLPYIALLSGITWVGAGGANGPVYALYWDNTNLWAGGTFTAIGGTAASCVARMTGGTWYALGSGMNSGAAVYALALSGTYLYVGGSFSTAGGVSAYNIAAWKVAGSFWSAVGTGISQGTVYSLAYSDPTLYVGGNFLDAGGSGANYIALWNQSGSTWSALGTGVNARVNAILVGGTSFVMLGGEFDIADSAGIPSIHFVGWDIASSLYLSAGTAASGDGVGNTINALVAGGSNVYAGGQFCTAGGVGADRVAKWDGTAWSAVGAGPKGLVYALAWDGTNLYAGGWFSQVGAIPANNIAKWDGALWSSLGSGTNLSVLALAWDGSNLYAGGNFTQAGGNTVNRVAKWDGANWSALGSGTVGVNSTVLTLAWGGSNLYAGGYFTQAGGNTVNRVAKWDGANWSALGSGVNAGVNSLLWYGGSLYAGGEFTSASGVSTNRVAKWDGAAWNRLGGGVGGAGTSVKALCGHGSYLYAAGTFTTAEGLPANRIARWDGTYWTTLGSGFDNGSGNAVNAIAATGDGVWAGGTFRQAGTNNSSDFALLSDPPSVAAHPSSQSTCTGGNATFSASAAGHALSYQWQEDTGSSWANVVNGGVYSNATTASLNLTGVTSGMFGYRYRCIVTGYCGTATSNPATLLNAPIVTTNPSDYSTCSGGGATFSVTASGASTYQWQVNPGTGWTNLSDDWATAGSTTATLTLVRVFRGANGYLYRCVVTNSCAVQATSGSAALTVCDMPPSVGTLYLEKFGNNQEITWTRLGNTSLVDRYEVYRSASPTGPFDTLVGTSTGDLSGITVDLSTQPSPSYYEVRAVKGTCNGPLVPQRSIWLFDEGAGSTAYDSVNSNHGQISNATWVVGQGVRGHALNFNGTNAFVSAVFPALPTGGAPYTLMAWVKPNVHDYGIIGWGAYCCQNSKTNALRLAPGGLANYWWANDMWANTASFVGAWHHVAATWDGVNRSIYVDGALAAGPTASSGLAVQDTANFRIGCTNYTEYFNGLLDEVAVFDEALSQSAIQGYMSGFGTLTPLDTIETVWHFNDGSGTTLSDARGSHPATLRGGTWTAGQSGSAVDFNGAGDYAEANPGPSPAGAITIFVRAWLDSATNWASFVEKYAGEDLDCWTLGFPSSGGKLCFTWNHSNPWPHTIVSNSVVPLGRWVNLAVASNGTTATFYIDGLADGTFPVGAVCTSGTTIIGGNLAGGDEFIDGRIDDLEIFDRYLTQAEIQALM